jgi:hypothetical protein
LEKGERTSAANVPGRELGLLRGIHGENVDHAGDDERVFASVRRE